MPTTLAQDIASQLGEMSRLKKMAHNTARKRAGFKPDGLENIAPFERLFGDLRALRVHAKRAVIPRLPEPIRRPQPPAQPRPAFTNRRAPPRSGQDMDWKIRQWKKFFQPETL